VTTSEPASGDRAVDPSASRRRRTAGTRGTGQPCPICLRAGWDDLDNVRVISQDRASYVPFTPDPWETEESLRTRLTEAYLRCEGRGSPHHLPIALTDGRFVSLRVGFVGAGRTGKTHLFTAMIQRLGMDTALVNRCGLRVSGLDRRLHQEFMGTRVRRMFNDYAVLDATPSGAPINLAEALLVDNIRTGRSYAVSFFDVSGERLQQADADRDFLGGLDGLVFVVDPTTIRGLTRLTGPTGGVVGDEAFRLSIEQLSLVRNPNRYPFIPIPAVVVVNKADRLRFQHLGVDHWLERANEDGEEVNLRTVRAESADVYAMLATHGGKAWLDPVERFVDTTLHYASATGVDPVEGSFPRDRFRPRRPLKPLLTLFAMMGIIDRTGLDQPAADPPYGGSAAGGR
jgi:hypothetical protein